MTASLVGRQLEPQVEAEARELDRGGWARLDVSDLNESDAEEETADLVRQSAGPSVSRYVPCGWCVMEPAGGEYLVVIDNGHYRVCPTCWGRSAGYVELREAGVAHHDALNRIIGQTPFQNTECLST